MLGIDPLPETPPTRVNDEVRLISFEISLAVRYKHIY